MSNDTIRGTWKQSAKGARHRSTYRFSVSEAISPLSKWFRKVSTIFTISSAEGGNFRAALTARVAYPLRCENHCVLLRVLTQYPVTLK